jgi:hypothetical protein
MFVDNSVYIIRHIRIFVCITIHKYRFKFVYLHIPLGSSVGRTASITSSVKKDNDLIQSNSLLNFGKCKNEILQILENDVLFLNKHFFMDYSLLIGKNNLEIFSQKILVYS